MLCMTQLLPSNPYSPILSCMMILSSTIQSVLLQWSSQVALDSILILKISFIKYNIWGNDKYFLPKLPWDVANRYTTRWCPHKIVMPHTMICCHIQASRFLQNSSNSAPTCIYVNRHEPNSYTKCILMLFGLFCLSSNFYPLDLHNTTHVASTNLRWNICEKRIENQTSLPLIGFDYVNHMFVDFLIWCISPPHCVYS